MEEGFGMTDFQFKCFIRDTYLKAALVATKAIKEASKSDINLEEAIYNAINTLCEEETGMSIKLYY